MKYACDYCGKLYGAERDAVACETACAKVKCATTGHQLRYYFGEEYPQIERSCAVCGFGGDVLSVEVDTPAVQDLLRRMWDVELLRREVSDANKR